MNGGAPAPARLAALLLALCASAPSTARAIPPDEVRALAVGESKIEKPPFGEIAEASAVEVDGQGAVAAELLPAGEVLIEAKAPGIARVFVFGRRSVRVLQLAIGPPAPGPRARPPAIAPPARAPGAEQGPPLDVAGEASYRALAAPADDLPVGPVPLPRYRFDLEGLQAEAKAAQALLAKAGLAQVRVSFSPLGIRLAGATGEAEKRRAVIAIYPAVLGRIRLDE